MLIVFDIDGTVTRTYVLDQELFARAFVQVYGWRLDTDWNHYSHATDQGITEEALSQQLGRPAVPAEILVIRERYMALLKSELVRDPETFQVPGAADTIQKLLNGGHGVAFATGCWEASARLKLASAGIDIAGLPIATADDSSDRFEILRLAIERANTLRPNGKEVYVGDGPWDLAAARKLGTAFVGIDCNQSGSLAAHGVRNVLPDFRDFERFVAALQDVTSNENG
jgi:phosphoglycolate phosphatase-like HAD superfamily hydrolase